MGAILCGLAKGALLLLSRQRESRDVNAASEWSEAPDAKGKSETNVKDHVLRNGLVDGGLVLWDGDTADVYVEANLHSGN